LEFWRIARSTFDACEQVKLSTISVYDAIMTDAASGRLSRLAMEHGLKPLAMAVCFVLVALLWTFPLQHVIAFPFVFLFFGAVMASAWFGGLIAGAWAIVLSSVLIAFFFMPPLYSIAVNRELETYYAAFIVCAIAITAISAARRRSENISRIARDELELRVRERTAELEQSNLETLERERQLRLLTEAIPQQIWRANANGAIEYCNRDLIEFTGRSIEKLQGEELFAIFHASDLPIVRRTWNSARRTGTHFEVESRVRDAGGNYRWFLIRGIPQRTANGEVSSWYGVHIDIEERYRAEQALRVAQGDSARWLRTMSMAEMAASVAHELKQPLTALIAQAHACRRWLRAEPMNPEKAAHAAENLVRESDRASAVIDRIRSLFSGKDLPRETVDMNRLIGNVAQLLRDEAERLGVSIRLELSEKPLLACVDPVQIEQLLLNLVTNGLEATMSTGRAREVTILSTVNSVGNAMITVRDNGCGLSDQTREKMFDPFFTTKSRGTGIGLSICRSIVEAHDGRIWADALEEGSAFHVVLGSKES
jgi:PAS domain S-box-containing protein